MHSLSSYSFDLPEELIAQAPATERDRSRLMIVDRGSQTISEIVFRDLPDLLESGDRLIFNNTKVLPARLSGRRESGGQTEVFLLREVGPGLWRALAKPLRKLKIGAKIFFSERFFCELVETHEDGVVLVAFNDPGSFKEHLSMHGKIPLPPYIHRDSDQQEDCERYQTVFASELGAVAAPTAGLHFTKEVLDSLARRGIETDYVTLHVGLGTFKPVTSEDVRQHQMHSEWFSISEETALRLNTHEKNKKQICVGTTSCRVLESVSNVDGKIEGARSGETNIFIYPGYQFKCVRQLLTNFHLPGSTLLMLVAAFGGYELIMEAYKKAVKDRYRFFSYGDAMLIL